MESNGSLESARELIGKIVRKKEPRSYQRDFGHHESFKPRLNGQQGKIHSIEEIKRQLENL